MNDPTGAAGWRIAALLTGILSTLLCPLSFFAALIFLIDGNPEPQSVRPPVMLVLLWPILFFVSAMAGFVSSKSPAQGLLVMTFVPPLLVVLIWALVVTG